jgi:hypothetical protein
MMNRGFAAGFFAVIALTCCGSVSRAAVNAEIREDCLPFNLDSVSVASIQGSWRIVDGGHSMFDFGGQEQQAKRALDIIHFYRMDSTCFAGRPRPPMVYLLASGRAPVGSMPGEQCESLDAKHISLVQRGEFWRLVSGSQTLFDFGNDERGAKQGLLAFRHYEFRYHCIVGSTGSSFQYLRL